MKELKENEYYLVKTETYDYDLEKHVDAFRVIDSVEDVMFGYYIKNDDGDIVENNFEEITRENITEFYDENGNSLTEDDFIEDEGYIVGYYNGQNWISYTIETDELYKFTSNEIVEETNEDKLNTTTKKGILETDFTTEEITLKFKYSAYQHEIDVLIVE